VWGPLKVPADHDHGHASTETGHAHARVNDLNLREVLTLAPLAIGCLWLGLYPTPMLRTLDPIAAKLTAPADSILNPVVAERDSGTTIHVISSDVPGQMTVESFDAPKDGPRVEGQGLSGDRQPARLGPWPSTLGPSSGTEQPE
jgi:hypothetical protein